MATSHAQAVCLAFVATTLTLGASASVAASSPADGHLHGTVVSAEPLEIDGRLETDPSTGVVHARSSHVDSLRASLSAQTLRVSYTWQSGEHVRATPEGDDLVRVIHDSGEETKLLDNATATIDGLQRSPEILVDASPSSLDPTVEAIGQGSVDVTGLLGRTLTNVEHSPNTTAVGETPPRHGFSYTLDEPRISVDGLDEVTVQGSFAIFVNNVTLDASTPEEDFEHWTGYQERSVGPASTFESRVTRIYAEDATLTLRASNKIDLVSEGLSAHLSGHVNTTRAVGTLASDTTEYEWNDDKVSLDGTGKVTFAAKPSLDAYAAVSNGSATQLPVEMGTEGRFDVAQTQNLAVSSQTTVEQASPASSIASWWWLIVPLVLVSGVITLGRRTLGAKIDSARAELRERRVQSWMQTGDRLTSVREFERALKWYDQTTETYPNHAEAWYAKGACLAEMDDHEGAAQAYARANELLGGDDPQLLDMAATEAWNAGDEELAMSWFEELADIEPNRFLQRIQEPGYQDLRERPRIQACLDSMDPETSPSVV